MAITTTKIGLAIPDEGEKDWVETVNKGLQDTSDNLTLSGEGSPVQINLGSSGEPEPDFDDDPTREQRTRAAFTGQFWYDSQAKQFWVAKQEGTHDNNWVRVNVSLDQIDQSSNVAEKVWETQNTDEDASVPDNLTPDNRLRVDAIGEGTANTFLCVNEHGLLVQIDASKLVRKLLGELTVQLLSTNGIVINLTDDTEISVERETTTSTQTVQTGTRTVRRSVPDGFGSAFREVEERVLDTRYVRTVKWSAEETLIQHDFNLASTTGVEAIGVCKEPDGVFVVGNELPFGVASFSEETSNSAKVSWEFSETKHSTSRTPIDFTQTTISDRVITPTRWDVKYRFYGTASN